MIKYLAPILFFIPMLVGLFITDDPVGVMELTWMAMYWVLAIIGMSVAITIGAIFVRRWRINCVNTYHACTAAQTAKSLSFYAIPCVVVKYYGQAGQFDAMALTLALYIATMALQYFLIESIIGLD